jgi:hypothetical protein
MGMPFSGKRNCSNYSARSGRSFSREEYLLRTLLGSP